MANVSIYEFKCLVKNNLLVCQISIKISHIEYFIKHFYTKGIFSRKSLYYRKKILKSNIITNF